MATIEELAQRHCRPLRGPEHRLSDAALAEGLRTLAGWTLEPGGAGITRTFTFPDYHRTMAFVNALAYIAHREDHHPDLGVHYDRAVVRYSTHDVGGISENDLICAARASRLAED